MVGVRGIGILSMTTGSDPDVVFVWVLICQNNWPRNAKQRGEAITR
jgi:hypothetical protein